VKNARSTTFSFIFDELVKSPESTRFVIPAKAGIQCFQTLLDPGLRRDDVERTFYEPIKVEG
jgi:hypothetical protein